MKRNNITQYLIPLLLLLLAACGKEEKIKDTPILGLGGDTWVSGPIDDWLKKEFLDPYNIEVKYRWDPYELNYVKSIVPIREEKIQPSMSSVREIWIKPYVKVAGESFIKKYAPKQFVLAGSAEWNNDGTIVLGQAEGGRKIVLLLLNEFDPKDRPQVERMLHTMHHEFAHILHQTKLYPLEWKALNPEWYTATWFNNTDEIAHQQGLISAYAKANADEDFVETVSFLLVYGQAHFDSVVNKENVPAKAKAILRKKESMVVDYFTKQYQIDFRALQRETQSALAAFLAE